MLEHEHDFASLSKDERYIRVVAHIHAAEARDIKREAKITVDPDKHTWTQLYDMKGRLK